MEIFVISLRSARARRTHVAAEMAAAGLRFRFFDAVEADSEPERNFVATNLPPYEINARLPPLPSEIACYASHLAVWRRCVELGAPVVVLEDDFRLLPGFARALRRLEVLTREFGFVRIQSLQRGRCRSIPKVERNDGELALHYLADVPLCMLAYSIDPAAAAALIESSAYLYGTRGQVHAAYVGTRRTTLRLNATTRRYRNAIGPVHDRRPITQELEPLTVGPSSHSIRLSADSAVTRSTRLSCGGYDSIAAAPRRNRPLG